jgi:hypothetical protein
MVEGGKTASTKGVTVMLIRPLSAKSSATVATARANSLSSRRVSTLSLTLRCANRSRISGVVTVSSQPSLPNYEMHDRTRAALFGSPGDMGKSPGVIQIPDVAAQSL